MVEGTSADLAWSASPALPGNTTADTYVEMAAMSNTAACDLKNPLNLA